MKEVIRKTIIIITVITGLFTPARQACADFDDTGIGARPIAMGSAFVGLADDANSIYYNPAGLGLLTRNEVTSTYGKLFMGLTDGSSIANGFIGYVHPLNKKIGTVGIGWLNLSLRDNNALIEGEEEESLLRYSENTFIISFGRDITEIAGEPFKKLLKWKNDLPGSISVGVNVKFMMKFFGLDDYSRDELTASGPSGIPILVFGEESKINNTKVFTSYDVGLFYRLDNYHTSFGLTLTDILSPYTALQEETEEKDDMDLRKLPRGLKFGVAYREPMMNIVLDLKLKAKDFDIHVGIERWFHGRDLALRAGYMHGSRSLNNITAGACYKAADKYQLDYVFLYPLSGLSSIYGSHRVSLTIRFGEITEEREIRRQAESITKGIKRAKMEKREKIKRLDFLMNKFLLKVGK